MSAEKGRKSWLSQVFCRHDGIILTSLLGVIGADSSSPSELIMLAKGWPEQHSSTILS